MSVEVQPGSVESGDPLIGQLLANRYLIETLLGEGAMGAVYRARHVKVGRRFAVKVLHRKLLLDQKVALRFEREAELAGRLRHPNVIGVVDVGEMPDGLHYMVMDFAEGEDLANLLGEAPMPPARIINLVGQMLEGLYHAHEQGLIHRDFKPENVIIERDDHDVEVPRIVDFGIAILREGGDDVNGTGRLTTNGLVLGTPHYMAPEQAVADPIDHRIDLFALGIVIYEMLCGKLPFDGTGAEVARANLLLDPPKISDRVPYLEVDPLLEAYARRLMAKKRDHRPANAKVARELLDLISDDPAAAAAALGVPLTPGLRTPAVTQPVAPQPQPQPPPVSGRLAIPPRPRATDLEAPAAQAQVSTPLEIARSESEIETDRSRPVGRSRWPWLVAGLGALSIAAVVTVVALERTDAGPTPADPKLAALPAPPVAVPTPGPAPTPVPVAVVPAPTPEPTPEPTPPVTHEPVIGHRDPRGTSGTAKSRTKPTAKQLKPAGHPDATAVEHEVPKPVVDPTPPKPAIDPTPPKPAIDTAALYGLYGAVGQDLAVARKSRGPEEVTAIENQYRRIQIQDAGSTPAKREATAAILRQLRAALAPLKQPR